MNQALLAVQDLWYVPKINGDIVEAIFAAHVVSPFNCKFCDKNFTQKYHLKSHIAAIHEGKKPFNCNLCGKDFSFKHVLQRHFIALHGEKNPILP